MQKKRHLPDTVSFRSVMIELTSICTLLGRHECNGVLSNYAFISPADKQYLSYASKQLETLLEILLEYNLQDEIVPRLKCTLTYLSS